MTLHTRLGFGAGLLASMLGPATALALSITVDGNRFDAAPGANSINVNGLPGIGGFALQPSSIGATPLLSVTDSPTSKSMVMTDFALVGPQSLTFNTHNIVIEHSFTPLTFDAFVAPASFMGGSYGQANRLVIGGELNVSAFLNGGQIAGTAGNTVFTPPVIVPGTSNLIYHPADDIRFRGGDLPNHSCDNIIGNPTNFACFIAGNLQFLPAGTPLDVVLDASATFVFPGDRFSFPGSLDIAVSPIPEPIGLLVFAVGLLGLFGRRGVTAWHGRG